MYNVTFRRVYETIVAVEQQYVLHISVCVCFSSLSYPARKAHAPHYVIISGLPSSTTYLNVIS